MMLHFEQYNQQFLFSLHFQENISRSELVPPDRQTDTSSLNPAAEVLMSHHWTKSAFGKIDQNLSQLSQRTQSLIFGSFAAVGNVYWESEKFKSRYIWKIAGTE